jgi:hypothetical protein
MAYLGNTPITQSFISGTDYFNGTGSQTAFTLSRTVASINDIQVTVNNVVQQPNDAYTISGTTLTMTSAPSAGTNNVYVRYLSTTTQAITPSQNTVSWNTLDSNIQQDLGVMGKNRIINGNMVIDQRNAGASVTPTNNQYLTDRFAAGLTQASKFSVQQNAGSVTPPVGFTNYLGVTSLSAYSIVAGDIFVLFQPIEGFNTADLGWGTANAKTITLSFQVYSSLTGTFGGSLRNASITRSYPFSYTISSANTWTTISVTIAGDTTGTWVGATNGVGLYVTFGLGVGSTYSGTAGAWSANNYASATGATSVVGTNGATFYITGVQLEVGTQATAFSTAGGSYGAELALCQRYFFNVGGQVYSTASSGGTAYLTTWCFGLVKSPVTMRAMPTFTKTGNWNWNDYNSVNTNTGALTFRSTSSTLDAFWIASEGTSSGLTALQAYFLTAANDATARLSFSAEL